MATYAIGDLQGCYPELQRLLERIRFDPAEDQLWLCGDLINRGGQSIETLRLLHSITDNCIITLGNHDLGLLGIAERSREDQSRVNPELRKVLFAEDAPMLLDWLRQQKMLHYDKDLNWLMVHAGLAPNWTLPQALTAAADVERALRGKKRHQLLKQLFGDHPAFWSQKLGGIDRLRATINVLTRMRYVDTQGRISFHAKGTPGTQKPGLYPWYAAPGMRQRKCRVVFGHWSALGLFAGLGVYALDTGCVWGGKLTAMRLDTEQPEYIQVNAEPGRHRPPPKRWNRRPKNDKNRGGFGTKRHAKAEKKKGASRKFGASQHSERMAGQDFRVRDNGENKE